MGSALDFLLDIRSNEKQTLDIMIHDLDSESFERLF